MLIKTHIFYFLYITCVFPSILSFSITSFFTNTVTSKSKVDKDNEMKKFTRKFVPLRLPTINDNNKIISYSNLRILQFNILADGLSGLRSDLGAFSRVCLNDIVWKERSSRLFQEIVQYEPDIITLQECDHYYDYFLPKLSIAGYDGLYAPKPASACLEVSNNADGCCIFVKRKKIKIKSSETITYALSRADVSPDDLTNTEDDRKVRVQNQVALIAICDFVSSHSGSISLPSIVIATTHLKALKTAIGEKYRLCQASQLLQAVQRAVLSLQLCNKASAVILTGDLNAAPSAATTGYPSLTYTAVKQHPFNFRSVLNDDRPVDNHESALGRIYTTQENSDITENIDSETRMDPNLPSCYIWTTWKSRIKKGREKIAKHCIDYILYTPLLSNVNNRRIGIRATATLDLFRDEDVSVNLLPNSNYPSDHISIAADLEIFEEFPSGYNDDDL